MKNDGYEDLDEREEPETMRRSDITETEESTEATKLREPFLESSSTY